MTAEPPVAQATLDAAVTAAMDALCAVQWPALPGEAGVCVPVDHIARAAVTAALPVLAAAIGEQLAQAIEAHGRAASWSYEDGEGHEEQYAIRTCAAIARAGTSGATK